MQYNAISKKNTKAACLSLASKIGKMIGSIGGLVGGGWGPNIPNPLKGRCHKHQEGGGCTVLAAFGRQILTPPIFSTGLLYPPHFFHQQSAPPQIAKVRMFSRHIVTF